VGESLLGLAAETGVAVAELIGHQIVGACDLLRAPSASAIAHLARAIELAEKIQLPPPTAGREPDPLAMLRAIHSHALARAGRREEALAEACAARARAEATGHLPTLVMMLAFSTVTFSTLEEFVPTRDWAAEALELARGHRFPTSEAQARTLGGWGRAALGDSGGITEAETGLAQTLEIGLRGGLCHYILATAEANRLGGRLARAHELITLGESLYRETGEAVAPGRLHRARAHVLLAQGRTSEAADQLERAVARFELMMEPRERGCAQRELAAVRAQLPAA
jgi:hypothetical protein